MFDPTDHPRVFAVPPGADFPKQLVQGLIKRFETQPPEAMARVRLIVNTRRMARRIRALFDQGPPRLLPLTTLVTELGGLGVLPPPESATGLHRRLDLARLIRSLIRLHPDLASESSVFDLADSLAALIDEMQGEDVSADAIRQIDLTDQSGHWARALHFFDIAEQYINDAGSAPDREALHRRAVETLTHTWAQVPPDYPVILAGSTGSRGTTSLLMEAVARLPQGAVVLPGFDFDQPDKVWATLDDGMTAEDHPQYRFRTLMRRLDLQAHDVHAWTGRAAPVPERNRLVSLALRPAPFTDAWLSEGPDLSGLDTATEGLTLVEARAPRLEAQAIALRLRKAAEDGQSAALITPDRMLTRQVTAALDRWNIVPDDSAGVPLHLSPPGRFLRHLSELFHMPLTVEALLTLLKHPLCHDGEARGQHLLNTRELELYLRREGPPFPDGDTLRAFTEKRDVDPNWITWVEACFLDRVAGSEHGLAAWVSDLQALAERASAGLSEIAKPSVWDQSAGKQCLKMLEDCTAAAAASEDLNARDFAGLIAHQLQQDVVRDPDAPDGRIMIWGTLEARVQGADVLILGGLNEGVWPEAPSPDPWLNRAMRHQVGLLLPERRIGLSAHDFQQAINAPEVWLTRSVRSDESETVASRWLNRLSNLLSGLQASGGPDHLDRMRARGATWLRWADQIDVAPGEKPAVRPCPCPPVAARPRRLSVTEIRHLIRDPYAIYARHVLRLRPLDPLAKEPDAPMRGIVVHKVFETFVRSVRDGERPLSAAALLDVAEAVLNDAVAWPMARRIWLARMARIADWFISNEAKRAQEARPVAFEGRIEGLLTRPGFTLTGYVDRVDQTPSGGFHIYDYKTGAPPTEKQQTYFEKQLLLEAAVIERHGIGELSPNAVHRATFIGLGSTPKEVDAPFDKEPPAKVWTGLQSLVAAYLDAGQGFVSRRAMMADTDAGAYDQLARFGEWDRAEDAVPEVLR